MSEAVPCFAAGKVLREGGRLDEAISVVQQVLHQQPGHLDARRWLADSLLARGNAVSPGRRSAATGRRSVSGPARQTSRDAWDAVVGIVRDDLCALRQATA